MNDAVPRPTRPTLAALAILLCALPAAALGQQGGTAPGGPATPPPAAAPAPAASPALPPGVQEIRFGAAVRDRSGTGVPRCTIPQPLPPPPRFEPGTTEIGYTILVDPQVVKAVTAKVVGDLGCADLWTSGCVGYTICGGSVCQSQFGATVSCPGEKPLKKGSYKLALTVGGQTLELPFEIE